VAEDVIVALHRPLRVGPIEEPGERNAGVREAAPAVRLVRILMYELVGHPERALEQRDGFGDPSETDPPGVAQDEGLPRQRRDQVHRHAELTVARSGRGLQNPDGFLAGCERLLQFAPIAMDERRHLQEVADVQRVVHRPGDVDAAPAPTQHLVERLLVPKPAGDVGQNDHRLLRLGPGQLHGAGVEVSLDPFGGLTGERQHLVFGAARRRQDHAVVGDLRPAQAGEPVRRLGHQHRFDQRFRVSQALIGLSEIGRNRDALHARDAACTLWPCRGPGRNRSRHPGRAAADIPARCSRSSAGRESSRAAVGPGSRGRARDWRPDARAWKRCSASACRGGQ
jgi:hypothetical protein